MPELTLSVEKRQVLGRKVKKLRQEGVLPANIYGKKTKSLAVKVKLTDFSKVYKKSGETGLVEIEVKGEEKTRPALIHHLQIHPVNGHFLHVDFHQVVLTEKTKAAVKVEIVGQARAVIDKKGVLLTILSELEVEALPKDLPEKLAIDVSGLAEVNEQILVKDIKVSKGVAIVNAPGEVVVKIGALTKKEEETPPPPAKEEKTPAEGEEVVKLNSQNQPRGQR